MAELPGDRRSVEIDKSLEADVGTLPAQRDIESGEVDIARIEKVYKWDNLHP